MAIFIDIKEIAGDAKDMGWKPFAGSAQDPVKWFIRADSFTFNCANEEENDSEDQQPGAPAMAGATIGAGSRGTPPTPPPRPAAKKKKKKAGNSMTLNKKLDYASSSFANMVLNKKAADSSDLPAYEEAVIYVTSSQREIVLQITLKNVIATGYNLTFNSNEEGTGSTEEVTLQFQQLEWTYNESDTQGKIVYYDRLKWPLKAEA